MYQARNVYLICLFTAIGGCLSGFDIGSMSGILATEAYRRHFGDPKSYTQGGITAAMPFGSLAGALGSSFLADKFSRRSAIQIGCFTWIIGSILQCAAVGVSMLVVGRTVSGLGVGIASSVGPIYQSEIAPKEIRGRIVALQQWAITWGILIQYFIQYGASNIGGGPKNPQQPTAAFRIPWGVQIIPAVILLFGLFFLPRSPRWLASKNRWEEAVQVLADLHANGDTNSPRVLAEYQEIQEAVHLESTQTLSSYKQLVERRMLRRVVLGMSIQMWSQLSGMNIMMYYVIYIMEGANITSPLMAAAIQYTVNVVLTIPAIIYVDKWGRRPSFLLGSFVMMTCLCISGALQAVYGEPNVGSTQNSSNSNVSWIVLNNKPVSSAIVAFTYLSVATYAISWGPSSWIYPAEIFPSKLRAKAVSLATASNWFWNCVLAFSVPPVLWKINWRMNMLFAGFNALALIHVFLAAPETRGKPLEEMDEVFESGRPAWRSGPPTSRLDQLVIDIEAGEFKIVGPLGSEHSLTRRQKERVVASHIEELINQSVLAV